MNPCDEHIHLPSLYDHSDSTNVSIVVCNDNLTPCWGLRYAQLVLPWVPTLLPFPSSLVSVPFSDLLSSLHIVTLSSPNLSNKTRPLPASTLRLRHLIGPILKGQSCYLWKITVTKAEPSWSISALVRTFPGIGEEKGGWKSFLTQSWATDLM